MSDMANVYELEIKARELQARGSDLNYSAIIEKLIEAHNQADAKIRVNSTDGMGMIWQQWKSIKVYSVVGCVAAECIGLDHWALHHLPTGLRIGINREHRDVIDALLPVLNDVMAAVPKEIPADPNPKLKKQMRDLAIQIQKLGITNK